MKPEVALADSCSDHSHAPASAPGPDEFALHEQDHRRIAVQRYGDLADRSRYMQLRWRLSYHSPEEQYEALVDKLVNRTTSWLDVGCGRAPFPGNLSLCRDLADRCHRFVGVDPDDGIQANPFLHERCQATLDAFPATREFDLITARMVVEHVVDPDLFVARLGRLARPGGLVVVFTVNWWSLTTLAAHCTPLNVHHAVKKLIWQSEEQDTFPTVYKLNRRSALATCMRANGLDEATFRLLPDASLFWRIPFARNAELAFWKLTAALHLPYVDQCILAVYRREPDFKGGF